MADLSLLPSTIILVRNDRGDILWRVTPREALLLLTLDQSVEMVLTRKKQKFKHLRLIVGMALADKRRRSRQRPTFGASHISRSRPASLHWQQRPDQSSQPRPVVRSLTVGRNHTVSMVPTT